MNVRRKISQGFTLIELAMAIAMVMIMSATASFVYQDVMETADAEMLDAAQKSLQSVVSQASSRLDVNPVNLCTGVTVGGATFNANNVINAMTIANANNVNINHVSGSNFTVTMTNSSRSATMQVQNSGNVRVTGISGFPHFQVVNGEIEKI